MNKFIGIGRLTRDVEFKTLNNNKSLASFSIAIKRDYANADGNVESDFLNCKAFGKTAEYLNNYIKKGYLICIEGKIAINSYTDKDGNNRFSTDIIVDKVENLTPKSESENNQNNQPRALNTKTKKPVYDMSSESFPDDEDVPF